MTPLLRWVADGLLPRRAVLRHLEGDARRFLRHLFETNAARVENDLNHRLQERRRHLEGRIRSALAEALDTAG